jgi:hypothetical protein
MFLSSKKEEEKLLKVMASFIALNFDSFMGVYLPSSS